MKAQNQFSQTQGLRHAESGQAIVLLALVVLALVAMLGLAIDGGGLYLLWRNVQNATDAAALAGSYAKCTTKGGAGAIQAAIDQAVKDAAAKNGFNNDRVTNWVDWYNPPRPGHEKAGDPLFIEVEIRANKPSYFIQVIYREQLSVTNAAVGVCDPPFDPSMIRGLWAGSKVCNNNFTRNGADSYIEGGIFSNNEIKITGAENARMKVVGPVEAVNNLALDKVDFPNGDVPVKGVPPRDEDPLKLDINLYRPGGAVWEHVTLHTYIDGDWESPPATIEGLYFVEGNVKFQGEKVKYGPKGATIVATGWINMGNPGDNSATYYSEVMNYVRPNVRYPGILFYSDYDNPSCGTSSIGVEFSGGIAGARGVIYAPHSGLKVSGDSMTLHGAVIGLMIDYTGSDAKLYYDPTLIPGRPPSITIVQ